MSSSPDYRMKRNVAAIVGRGRVKFVNDGGAVQILQVQLNGLETPDNRYRVAEFGFTSNPPIDSDAIALHVAGDRSAGVVLGTNHQASRPTDLPAGATMIYSEDGKSVYLTADDGIIIEAKGQNVVVNDAANVTCNASGTLTINAPTIVLNGNVQINGNIGQQGAGGAAGTAVFTADITAPDLILPNGAVNGHDHYVPAAPGYSNTMTN